MQQAVGKDKDNLNNPNVFRLKCLECPRTHAPTVRTLHCPACDGLFDVEYAAPPDGDALRLPLHNPGRRLTLGEGSTPLVEMGRTAGKLGLGALYAKLEFVSPTGSFKDRGSSVLISAAVEEGVHEFVEDSSGNAGASMSAYAAAAGMKAHVFAPSGAAKGKLDQIAYFGSTLHTIDGPRQAATDAAHDFLRQTGLVYLSHNYSAYFAEGMKAVCREILQDAPQPFDHVVLPVGNGSLLIGMRKGFDELKAAGRIASLPRLSCVQAKAVRPVVASVNGEDWNPDTAGATVASGISVARPPRLAEEVAAVRHTGGHAIAVDEAPILEWRARLAREEGLFCEATAAAAFAGLEELLRSGKIQPEESVVIPVTGSGLKEPL